MRIIKVNKVEKIKKCSFCKTVFAYSFEDMHTAVYPTVKCPTCGKILDVSIFDKKVKESK
jgi:DNA-directed RNA polymerase subunit RPC12/RpoP